MSTDRPASAEPGSAGDPAAVYNGLLEDRGLAEASVEHLRDAQRRLGLAFGDRPLSISLRPNLVSRERQALSVAAAGAVHGALRRLERDLLGDPALRAELDLGPVEERLALADPGCRSSSPSSRLDSFFGERVRYVEYNAESPAGMAYGDRLVEVFDGMPLMRAFRRRFRARPSAAAPRQLAAMLRAFSQWASSAGRAEEPAIAIVDWPGLPTASEHELFRAYFESRGVPAVVCDPRELELAGGRLRAAGRHVNLVYRRVLTSELLARADEVRPLLDAYERGAACVVNTFRAKLLHKKMSLALLSDERHARRYTAAQRAAIERHVPWTRRVADGATTRAGRPVPDLLAHCADRREELVLKPNDDYGGRGVVLGWTVDQAEWERALRAAAEAPSVVQEAVEVPRAPFPVALDGVRLLDLAVDMDPFLFDGRPGGCLTRLSSTALLNVTAGAGSVVPTYVVEGPA
jgi:uncharacterized circularly permuted ATP-grasp superfamily protein